MSYQSRRSPEGLRRKGRAGRRTGGGRDEQASGRGAVRFGRSRRRLPSRQAIHTDAKPLSSRVLLQTGPPTGPRAGSTPPPTAQGRGRGHSWRLGGLT